MSISKYKSNKYISRGNQEDSGSGGSLSPADQALIAQIPNKQDTSEKGQPNGYAGLDGMGKVPLTQLPSNLKEIKIVADIAARNNIVVSDRFEGLSVLVEDASADPTVNSNYATYILKAGLTNADWFKTGEGESLELVLSALNTYYDNTTSGATSTNLQDATDEAFARIGTLESRPVGNSGEGKRYFISTPAIAGIYSATEIFTESPTTITKTFTNVYQTVFEAETEALNITTIPSGGWNTDISFTHTNDKDFTAKVSFYNGATLLGEVESLVLAGNEKIVLSKTFPAFAFTSGNKLKFKLETKSDHNGDISVFTNDGTNDLHIHTPVLIDVVNSAVQNALNLKQNNILKVDNQTEMLALSNVIIGDIVTRADDNYYLYRLNALPASDLTNWQVIGKDVPPIGETVEDIITTNEIITSKVNGLYAFAGVPNGGLPAGVARGDIAQKTGSSWAVVYTFANAPASIFAKSDNKVYNKKVDQSNNPTWFILPEPTFYEVGSGKEYATLQSAIDAYATSGKPLGVINIFDQTIAENVIINANTQNLLIQGFGTFGRANTQISKITILGHRVTLNTLQINEIEINSTGTITENGVSNIGRGKYIFDKVTFANSTTAITVTAINNFLAFYGCDFSSKIISIANHVGVPTSVTFNNCQNGILNLGSNRLCVKAYSPNVYRGTVTGTIIDLDSSTPIAYSLLRAYTALGLSVPISLGTIVINDDIGGNLANFLANLKCTTAYTIAPALGVGTPIDLTKYQVQTTATNLSITNRNANTLDVASDTGTDATIPQATITEAGLLNATDKVKLNNTSGTNTGDETKSTILTKIGYTPENIANKVTDLTSPNNTDYATTQAVVDYVQPIYTTDENLVLNAYEGQRIIVSSTGDEFGILERSYIWMGGMPQLVADMQLIDSKQDIIPDGNNINKISTNIASTATVNLDSATGDYIKITGTTTITAFTLSVGVEKTIEFDGALTLTHNGTSLILPTNANITTTSGDVCVIRGITGGVKMISYQKTDGTALAGSAMLPVITTLGNGAGPVVVIPAATINASDIIIVNQTTNNVQYNLATPTATYKRIRIVCGSSASFTIMGNAISVSPTPSLERSKEFVYINGSWLCDVGAFINGGNRFNAPLSLGTIDNQDVNLIRQGADVIKLREFNEVNYVGSAFKLFAQYAINNLQFRGFREQGVNLVYQIQNTTTASHSFHAAIDGATSRELMRLNGNGLILGDTTVNEPSALFAINSTTQGFLLPRMTQAQRDLISSPAIGLKIYNTTTKKENQYNGTFWEEVGGLLGKDTAPIGSIQSYYGDTAPQGYLLLHGATFLKADYPELWAFAVAQNKTTTDINNFGLFYHTNGANFRVPDHRALFHKGADVTTANGMVNGTNYNATTVGAFQNDDFKSHSHTLVVRTVGYSVAYASGAEATGAPNNNSRNNGSQTFGNLSSGFGISFTGGLETRPKNIGVNYIIKAKSSGAYTQTFNSTTDWTLNTDYEITILATTHGKGLLPLVKIFELQSGEYISTNTNYQINATNGNVVIKVPVDLRFAGVVKIDV